MREYAAYNTCIFFFVFQLDAPSLVEREREIKYK